MVYKWLFRKAQHMYLRSMEKRLRPYGELRNEHGVRCFPRDGLYFSIHVVTCLGSWAPRGLRPLFAAAISRDNYITGAGIVAVSGMSHVTPHGAHVCHFVAHPICQRHQLRP